MKACYPGADVDRLTKHIWRMYDTNNDGAIDFRNQSNTFMKGHFVEIEKMMIKFQRISSN